MLDSLSLGSFLMTVLLLAAIFALFLFFLFKTNVSHHVISFFLLWFPIESVVLRYTREEYVGYTKFFPEVLMYAIALIAWIAYIRRTKKFVPRTPLNRPLAAFLAIAVISLIINWYHPAVWALGVRQIIRFVVLFFFILFLGLNEKQMKGIVAAGLIALFLQALFGAVQYASRGSLDPYLFSAETITVAKATVISGDTFFWKPGTRMFGTMGRYDRFGSFIALGLVCLFPWIYYAHQKQKQIVMIGFALLAICLFLSISRASWLAALGGVTVIGLAFHKDKRVLIFLTSLVSLAILLTISFALTRDNLSSIIDRPEQSLTERLIEAGSPRAWRESYDGYGRIFFIINTPRILIPNAFFFGFGPGNYGGGVAAALFNTRVYDRFGLPFGIQNIAGQIDNSWFSLWGETGTFGLIAWIAVFITLIRMALRVRQDATHAFEKILAESMIGGICVLSVLGFFGPYFDFRTLNTFFWTNAGIVALLWQKQRGVWSFLN